MLVPIEYKSHNPCAATGFASCFQSFYIMPLVMCSTVNSYCSDACSCWYCRFNYTRFDWGRTTCFLLTRFMLPGTWWALRTWRHHRSHRTGKGVYPEVAICCVKDTREEEGYLVQSIFTRYTLSADDRTAVSWCGVTSSEIYVLAWIIARCCTILYLRHFVNETIKQKNCR